MRKTKRVKTLYKYLKKILYFIQNCKILFPIQDKKVSLKYLTERQFFSLKKSEIHIRFMKFDTSCASAKTKKFKVIKIVLDSRLIVHRIK